MTFNTGNPIGSTDARDLSDNAENFDKALGTTAATWVDRFGVTRDSFEGRLAKGSFYRVGTFAAGYTLTNMRQTLEYSGHEYSWAGTFPKVVAAGATPATSGGIGAGAWVDRTDVTLRTDLASTTGAGLVGYQPAGTGAAATTVQSKLGETVSVFDFYANGVSGAKVDPNGIIDSTAGIQAAINFGALTKCKVRFPAGTYLVTDTLNLPIGSQLIGETGFQYTRGFNIDPKATTINFQPTALKSLFVCSGASYSDFRFHYSIEGFYLRGNSTDATGNSFYALDLDGSIYSRYENIGIEQFRTGIRCNRTINNRFCNIYATGKVQAVLYAGNMETTDVWDQCSFHSSPIGVQTAGSSIAIRFTNCLFEQLDTYGVNLTKESQNLIFENCYSEDVCFGGSATSAMFRVGFDGTSNVGPTQLTVIGGFYAGRNAGSVGAFVTADTINGVVLVAPDVRRFATGILTSANTPNNTIVVQGLVAQSVTTLVTDIIKIAGVYPSGVFNGSNRNQQRAIFGLVTTPVIRGDTTSTGSISLDATFVYAAKAGGALIPISDNNIGLGSGALRWSVVYAGTGTINTSDARDKQQVRDLSVAERAVAVRCKGLIRAFKFNDAVQAKGDGARIHFGVMAQNVVAAFASEGLDASSYALLCYDEWESAPEVLDDDGTVITPAREAGNRYGIRYEELLAFIIAAL